MSRTSTIKTTKELLFPLGNKNKKDSKPTQNTGKHLWPNSGNK